MQGSPPKIDAMSEFNSNTKHSYRLAFSRGIEKIGDVLGADTPDGRVLVTVPNYLTLGRLLSVPVFLYALFAEEWWLQFSAFILFTLAAVSDLWDGRIARRWGQVTAFGDFMDPLADKILVLAGFWALLYKEDLGGLESFATIFAALITLREITLTALRVKFIRAGSSVTTSVWGKWKTGIQLTCLLAGLAALNLRGYLLLEGIEFSAKLDGYFDLGLTIMYGLSAASSLISGWLYFKELPLGRSKRAS